MYAFCNTSSQRNGLRVECDIRLNRTQGSVTSLNATGPENERSMTGIQIANAEVKVKYKETSHLEVLDISASVPLYHS